jgi:Protein of unknown function (DUF2948)
MAELNLIALDADDLAIMSAHLQDALLKVGDMAWLPAERRFAAVGNRFDWAEALKVEKGRPPDYIRRRSGLRFERVQAAQLLGLDLQRKDAILSLLAINFEPAEPPAGSIILRFADGSAIRLQVECVEAEVKDLGPVWRAASMPNHADDTPAPKQDP